MLRPLVCHPTALEPHWWQLSSQTSHAWMCSLIVWTLSVPSPPSCTGPHFCRVRMFTLFLELEKKKSEEECFVYFKALTGSFVSLWWVHPASVISAAESRPWWRRSLDTHKGQLPGLDYTLTHRVVLGFPKAPFRLVKLCFHTGACRNSPFKPMKDDLLVSGVRGDSVSLAFKVWGTTAWS